ncbi:HAD family hydrolase, partial [Pelagicoccus mobilis]
CIGVLYGYGDREELTQAGAKRIVASVEELKQALLPKNHLHNQ